MSLRRHALHITLCELNKQNDCKTKLSEIYFDEKQNMRWQWWQVVRCEWRENLVPQIVDAFIEAGFDFTTLQPNGSSIIETCLNFYGCPFVKHLFERKDIRMPMSSRLLLKSLSTGFLGNAIVLKIVERCSDEQLNSHDENDMTPLGLALKNSLYKTSFFSSNLDLLLSPRFCPGNGTGVAITGPLSKFQGMSPIQWLAKMDEEHNQKRLAQNPRWKAHKMFYEEHNKLQCALERVRFYNELIHALFTSLSYEDFYLLKPLWSLVLSYSLVPME
jgi:hypothetical protein